MIESVVLVAYVLCAYIVASHVFFLFVINKLINKLMSRDFHDYQKTPEQPKPVEPEPQPMQDYIGRVYS